ncbi:MAG: lipoate--protein ligase [Clostridiales bacterium]|nr:lipoate--protein ligase [Clostridiales bacterium]
MTNRYFETANTDPALNLAIEEALLLQAGGPALFLWQNAHTVVIGRGQNAWKECRAQLLEQEGGTLVRRSTGGGAVYHDLGNLNFSFVMPKDVYDVPRQLGVISAAAASFGIKTQASGRNDIVLSQTGAKFSGNAFRHTQTTSLHHGTILLAVDFALLGRYLQPSRLKLQAKGVDSVRARVGNLIDHAPGLTLSALKAALLTAFEREYGPTQRLDWRQALPEDQVAQLAARYRDWGWTYGKTPRFDLSLEQRFPFGSVELQLLVKRGQVAEARCFTDANDPDLASQVEAALTGAPFTTTALADRLATGSLEMRQLGEWLRQQQL